MRWREVMLGLLQQMMRDDGRLSSAGFVPLRPQSASSTGPSRSHYGPRPIMVESQTSQVANLASSLASAVRVAQIVAHSSSVFDSSVTRSTTRRSSRDFNCLMWDGAERCSDGCGRQRPRLHSARSRPPSTRRRELNRFQLVTSGALSCDR